MPTPKVWEAAPLTSPSAALPMLEVLWRVLVESMEQTKAAAQAADIRWPSHFFGATKATVPESVQGPDSTLLG